MGVEGNDSPLSKLKRHRTEADQFNDGDVQDSNKRKKKRTKQRRSGSRR